MGVFVGYLFVFLFSLASIVPFIFIPSTGHDILIQPFNIFLCELVVAGIFFGTLSIYKKQQFVWSPSVGWLWVFPFLVLLSGMLNGFEYPRDIAIRLATICAALLFVGALLQLQPSRRAVDTAIYIIIAAMLLNVIESVLQMLPDQPLNDLIPHPPSPRPLGYFMQPNLLASALVTGLVLTVYQISTPGFPYRARMLQWMVYIFLVAGSYIVLATGSRIGLLALCISVPLVIASRYMLLNRYRYRLAVVITLLCVGTAGGAFFSDGFEKTYSKIERLAESSSDIRPHLYRISLDLFLQKPFAGHGVGNFSGVFQNQAAEYVKANPEYNIRFKTHFTHPHNELLMWAVEGGVIALVGLLVLVFVIVLRVFKSGWQRGGALLAMVLPIALHMQVELPLYISVYHTILFCLVVYLIFRPVGRKYAIGNQRVLVLVPVAGCVFFIFSLVFFTNTFKASRQISQFLYYNEPEVGRLDEASANFYFRDLGTALLLKVLLNRAISGDGDPRWVDLFILHNEEYLKKVPESSTFHDLALAYAFKGDEAKADEVIRRGLNLYPKHPSILAAKERVLSIVQGRVPEVSE